jgi:hypothetical protein
MQSVEIKLFGFFILKKSICLVAVPNQTHLSKPMFRPVGGMVSDGKGHTPHRSNSIALASGKGKRCWAVAPVVVTHWSVIPRKACKEHGFRIRTRLGRKRPGQAPAHSISLFGIYRDFMTFIMRRRKKVLNGLAEMPFPAEQGIDFCETRK